MSWFYQLSARARKATAVFFILIFLASSGVSFLLPRQAQAVPVEDVLGFPVAAGKWIWDRIQAAAEFAWKHGAAVAYRNAARTFTQRVAYDLAVYIGSAGHGQQPLFVTKGWGEYLEDVGDSAAGDFLDTLARDNGYLKFGLCEPLSPSGPSAKLIIGLTAFDEIRPRKPRCKLSDIQRNWQAALADPKKFLKKFNVVFDPRQHDLGVALHVRENVIAQKETEKKLAEAERIANRGLKAVTEPITGAIKTPAAFLESQFGVGLKSASDEPLQITGDVAADALGTFTNTLASRLLKLLFQRGLVPNPSGSGPSSIFGPSFGGGGIDYAVQVNTSISTPQLVSSNVAIDIISELVNCPTDTKYATVNNCTIDRKFEQLLRKADEGQALTLQEAIKQNLISGGWSFKTTRPSTTRTPDAWYLSDLKKLRKARVVSVGWELAAEKFANSTTTLQQVVEAFDSCTDFPDRCKLIDPNWVLRAPPSQCRLQGPGQILEPQGGGNRQDSCADVEQCVAEAEDGSCQAWGYCLAEKNIWRFAGDSCEFPQGSGYSPYATCQTFESGGNQLSLLTNSLANYDDGVCSGAAGCRWYSTVFNPAAGSGPDRYSAADSDRYYLKNVDKYACTSTEQGCTSFLRLQSVDSSALVGESGNNPAEQLVNKVVGNPGETYSTYASTTNTHLKEAPDYLKCYDLDSVGLPITSNDSAQCKNYLKWCSEAEIGCEQYAAADGSPAVPAILQPTDYCPQACVGLDRYYQTPSFFDPTLVATADFIPTTAQICPAQAAGCEEFTNLDQSIQGERREYYSKLRQCIAAADPQAATYFTWAGSDLTGFQLKDWRLQSSNASNPSAPPFTPPASGDCQANFGTTNPDCKQFYTLTGAIHYRYAADVVTASALCSRYRATNVKDATICTDTNGTWDAGACIYNAIPNEGQKCEARYNGCREYKGPTANNVKLVFPISTFGDQESTAGLSIDASPTSGWGLTAYAWSQGTNSNESTSAFGHSFDSGLDGTVGKDVSGQISAGKQYLVTFWAKQKSNSASQFYVQLYNLTTNQRVQLAPVPRATQDWNIYTFGPVEVPQDTTIFDTSGLVVLQIGLSPIDNLYIDNVVFKEATDSFFVIKNSWVNPAVCEALPAPSRYLGCKAYTDRVNRQVTATGFSQLCRAEAVGCEPLINTQNSDSPQPQTVTAGGQTITTPADQVVYRVYDADKACPAQAEACRLVGQPNLSAAGAVTSWGDKLVKLDPDKFDPANPLSPLCTKAQDRCQEFKQADGSRHYFKDPGNSLCEYKQVNPLVGYQWYNRGTTEFCNLVTNASFEITTDHGRNLLVNGDFEQPTGGAPSSWTVAAGSWTTTNLEYYDGKQSVTVPSAGTPHLTQTIRVTPSTVYTARVWTNASSAAIRNLRVFGCGVDMTDTTEVANAWQKLQLTFKPTTSSCTVELRSSVPAGDTYYDVASVYLAEEFTGWNRNGARILPNDALTNLSVKSSIAGQYWGSQVVEVESAANLYSGIWSDPIDLVATKDEPRYFTISANVYVPDIPQNNGMLDWQLSQHAFPDPTCPQRNGVGPATCHHYDYESNSDFVITAQNKGKWVYKQSVIKVDPGVRYLSVGLITNFGQGDPTACTADSCRPNQLVYLDQVSITEGKIQPAYQCPADQASCTAWQDPQLTQATYYYLNNKKLDRSSCAGQVGEKDGCLLFSDLSNSAQTWDAAATYAKSQQANNSLVTPLTAPQPDTNTILRVNRSRVCGEWLSCQSEALQYDQTGNSKAICYSLGRCDSFGSQGASKCGNWKTVADPAPLTAASYQIRGTAWADWDLSGYSIPHIYPLDTLKQKRYSTDPNDPNIRLTFLNDNVLKCGGTGATCTTLYSKTECSGGLICLPEDKGISGQGPGEAAKSYPNTAGKLCRLYPEPSAPFPSDLATFKPGGSDVEGGGNIERKVAGFTDANICQPTDASGQAQNCECSYQRASYEQSETRYYSLFSQPDSSILTDKESGSKSRLKRQDYLLGLRGYCLERDTSRAINGVKDNACLTWLPLDVVSGDTSIYDYAPDAGFNSGNRYYCSETAGLYDLGKAGNCTSAWPEPNGTTRGACTSGYRIQSHFNSIGNNTSDENFGCNGFCEMRMSTEGSIDANIPEEAIAKISVKTRDAGGEFCNDNSYYFNGDLERREVNALNYGPGVTSANYFFYEGGQYGASGGTTGPNTMWVGIAFSRLDHKAKFIYTLKDHTCEGDGQGYGQIWYFLKEYCTETVQVGNSTENKGWTNRLVKEDYQVEPVNELGYKKSRSADPYGSLTTMPRDFLLISDKAVTSPYACSGNCGPTGMCIQGKDSNGNSTFGKQCLSSQDCGTDGFCSGYLNESKVITSTPAPVGRERVRQLFAKEYGIQTWSGGVWSSSASGVDISGPVLGSLGAGVPAAPEIRQVNFVAGSPIEGATGFTILALGKTYTNETLKSPAEVNAVFYAYNPNGEQMPLREVRVDWLGDSDNAAGAVGKYKNHKNVCQSAKNPDGTPNTNYNFGDSSQACVDDSGVGVGYFTFTRSLTCNAGGSGMKNCDDPGVLSYQACWDDNAAGPGVGACVYTPRIYVRDNWDWCRGTSGGRWGISPTLPPSPAPQCDLIDHQAWLQFNGRVIVKP